MSKTNEELNELKKEVEAVNEKLQELTPEEIAQVNGGIPSVDLPGPGGHQRIDVCELS